MIDCIINTALRQSADFLSNLESLAIEIIHLPSIVIEPLITQSNQLQELIDSIASRQIDYVVVSSVNSIEFAPKALIDALVQDQTKIAAAGPISAKVCESY